MHFFVQLTTTSWVHTARIRAFETDADGFLVRLWLDNEPEPRAVTKRLRVLDGPTRTPSAEWPFRLEPSEPVEVRQ
jgi:hypothetical protein